jgi:hypothetical protein
MHGVDTVFPVFGARFNRSVTAQLALVMRPLAFTIQKGEAHHHPAANVGNHQQRRPRPLSHNRSGFVVNTILNNTFTKPGLRYG